MLKTVSSAAPAISEDDNAYETSSEPMRGALSAPPPDVTPLMLASPSLPRLAGKKFVVTGTLTQFTRAEITSLIKQAGGTVLVSISKNCDFLVLRDKPGSKLDEAKELSIPMITEHELLSMVGMPIDIMPSSGESLSSMMAQVFRILRAIDSGKLNAENKEGLRDILKTPIDRSPVNSILKYLRSAGFKYPRTVPQPEFD